MPYAVIENGNLLVDCTYDFETLAKVHYLAFHSGDYDLSEFGPMGLDAHVQFENYPQAQLCEVDVSIVKKTDA